MAHRITLATSIALTAACWTTPEACADIRPVSDKAEVACLPPAAAALYADTTLFPRTTRWREGIPWMLDLEKAIARARQEARPILIWTSGDDPLERC